MLSYLLRVVAFFVLASVAHADDYPSRSVKIIAPFGAGGPTDVYTRDIVEELRNALHQTFYIENRPGAGTTIGTDMVAKADPDGYTLLMVSGTQTVNETLYNQRAISSPAGPRWADIKAAWEKQGATPLVMSQPEFQSFMAAEVVKWAKVIKDNNIATIK